MFNSKSASAGSRSPDVLAAVLSYLVPGLGQIYQRRFGKGLLFLVCLYGLFFVGMAQGQWKNVYLPDLAEGPPTYRNNPWHLPIPLANVYNRLQFAGQFWIGIAAWPAIYQYKNYDANAETGSTFLGDFQRQPKESLLNELQANGDKTWDLAWVYTVIAGVLNILVIYDAFAGPTFHREGREPEPAPREEPAAV
jgi:small-conductance mechanosensitive channel